VKGRLTKNEADYILGESSLTKLDVRWELNTFFSCRTAHPLGRNPVTEYKRQFNPSLFGLTQAHRRSNEWQLKHFR
jgi:hypothetical protein